MNKYLGGLGIQMDWEISWMCIEKAALKEGMKV